MLVVDIFMTRFQLYIKPLSGVITSCKFLSLQSRPRASDLTSIVKRNDVSISMDNHCIPEINSSYAISQYLGHVDSLFVCCVCVSVRVCVSVCACDYHMLIMSTHPHTIKTNSAVYMCVLHLLCHARTQVYHLLPILP